MNPKTCKQRIVTWLAERHPTRDATTLRPDTPLVDEGWLNSLDALDLLLFLEECTGAPVPLDRLGAGSFESIDRLVDGVLGDDGEVAA